MKRLLIATTLACVLSSTALAGDMPGVNHASVTGCVTTIGVTGETSTVCVSVAGDMPGVNSASSSTDLGLVTTALLTFITLLGR